MARLVLKAACVVSAMLGVVAASAQAPHTHQHRFDDAHKWSQIFDDPGRDTWQKPHDVIQALALKPDAVIADIGAGTGYFAVRFAHMVAKGRVYAVDTEPAMVQHVAERAKHLGLGNLTALRASPQDPGLPEKVDLMVFVDVYHHVEHRDAYLRRLRDALKPGGRVAIIDFRMDSPVGPPRSARVAPAQVKGELERAGYRLAQEHDFLPNQYFLVFTPGKS
ncbi:MAG: methyltransferase domain-containing protein [Betaproteobacteria bacterium]|nr:methyltransferase domain-containing protein [Betaproteobacteria bacterium]